MDAIKSKISILIVCGFSDFYCFGFFYSTLSWVGFFCFALFFCGFVIVCFLETRSHCLALSSLELTVQVQGG